MKDEGSKQEAEGSRHAKRAVSGRQGAGKLWLRVTAAVIGGNVLGYGAWGAAGALIPRLWAGRGPESPMPVLMGLIALSVVVLAAPPVLIGALAGWVARRWHLWVGLASGLWAITLVGWVPAEVPIAAGLWYAPTVLVMLSSALGAWSSSGVKDEG